MYSIFKCFTGQSLFEAINELNTIRGQHPLNRLPKGIDETDILINLVVNLMGGNETKGGIHLTKGGARYSYMLLYESSLGARLYWFKMNDDTYNVYYYPPKNTGKHFFKVAESLGWKRYSAEPKELRQEVNFLDAAQAVIGFLGTVMLFLAILVAVYLYAKQEGFSEGCHVQAKEAILIDVADFNLPQLQCFLVLPKPNSSKQWNRLI